MPKYIRHILIELCGMVGSAVIMSCADRMPEMPGASDPTEGYFFVLDTGDGRGTRASVTSDWSTLADEGDIFGAFNLGNASDPENVRYSVRNVADRQVLVPAVEGTGLTKQATDYLFYYPYDPEMTMEKARDLEHSVMADQQQDGAFESSDLLWDVAHASDTKCLVALDHAMASVMVIAQAEGNDFFNNVKILGQPLAASGIDLTADGPDALNYDTDEGASDITALYAPYSTDADHYRAVVPANRTIPSGTRIISHYSRDGVHEYTLPEGLRITNQTARERGHVAIPTDGSRPYVSYDPYSGATDASGNRVGYTLPHCLVDKRINSEGKMERRAYPLVKIGFNQFWMSKSFQGKTLTDGTPLRCYNLKNEPGKVFLRPDLYPRWEMPVPVSGYVYPMLPQIVMGSYSGADTMADYIYLHHYLGKQSTVKLMSNQIQTRDDNGPLESPHDAFMKGKYLFFHDLNMYPGNVSGFNLKSHGRIFGYIAVR